tara:strand:+ start:17 stop:1798 length:1782 start_codon:yes stop_codon:yes gene_type:complete
MNFYNFITDPTNNVKVNINSATAKKVIENYINYINTHSQQFGGSKQFTLPTHPKVGDEFHDNQRERDRNRRRKVRKKQFHDSRDLVVGAPAAAAAPEQAAVGIPTDDGAESEQDHSGRFLSEQEHAQVAQAAEERLAKEAEEAARVTQEEVRRAAERLAEETALAAEERLAKEAEEAARVTQEEVIRAKEAEEVQRVAEEAVRVAEAERLAKEAEETALAAAKTARAAEEARQAAEEAEMASKAALAVAEEARRLEEVRIAQIKATELAKEEANRKEEERRDDEEIAQLRKELAQVESETVTVQAKKDQTELDIQTGAAIAKIKQDTEDINVAAGQLKDMLSADKAELKTALPAKEDEYECILCYDAECAPSKAFIIDDEECVCFECIVKAMFNPDPAGQYLSDGGYDHHPPLTRVSLRYILERLLPDNFADKRVWAKFRFDGDVDNIDNPGHFSKMTTCLKRGVACRRKVNVADDEADEADGTATEEEVVDGDQTDFYIDATSFSFLQGLKGVMSESDGMPITNMITNYLTNKYKYDRDKLATLKTTKETKELEEAKSVDNLSKLGERKAELEVKLGVDTRWGQVKHFFGRG